MAAAEGMPELEGGEAPALNEGYNPNEMTGPVAVPQLEGSGTIAAGDAGTWQPAESMPDLGGNSPYQSAVGRSATSELPQEGVEDYPVDQDLEKNLNNCFPPGVPVPMQLSGGTRAVEEVRPGDMVWAYDPVRREWRPCRVIQTFSREYEGHSAFVTAAGEEIESTLLHPYWVLRGEGLAERPRREHLPWAPERSATPGRWVDAGDVRRRRGAAARRAGGGRGRARGPLPGAGVQFPGRRTRLLLRRAVRRPRPQHQRWGMQSPPIIDNLERINKEWMERNGSSQRLRRMERP